MTNILWFEKDEITYAKGFFNQEGFSVYVLPGYEDLRIPGPPERRRRTVGI